MTNRAIHITLPESWDQLTEPQLEYVSRLLYNEMPATELLIRCLLHFTGIRLLHQDPFEIDGEMCYLFKKKGTGIFHLDVDMVTTITNRISWITSDITLFKNPEKIKHYTGCNYKLYGVTLEEWLIVDQMYIGYAKTKNLQFIDKMLAILYKLPSESWNESAVLDKRARRFRWMPAYRKYLIFLWYTSCKLWLKIKYPFLFAASDGSGKGQSANDYVMGLLSALNDGDVTHNPMIKATECHEVFYELNRKIEKSQTF
jgi:hypothetical protein